MVQCTVMTQGRTIKARIETPCLVCATLEDVRLTARELQVARAYMHRGDRVADVIVKTLAFFQRLAGGARRRVRRLSHFAH